MIALNGMVAVMKLIEFFTAIYVQHIGPASGAQNAIKLTSRGFFVRHVRKGGKTDNHVHAGVRQGHAFCLGLICTHMGKARGKTFEHCCGRVERQE